MPHHDSYSSFAEEKDILDAFPDKTVMMVTTSLPWYGDFANYVVCGIIL